MRVALNGTRIKWEITKASGQSGTINQFFNPAAFAQPTAGTLGNNRRNDVYGPGLHVINGSIHKTFAIHERVSFDLAANATNLVNHPSFAIPDVNIGAGHHGQITAVNEGGRIIELVGQAFGSKKAGLSSNYSAAAVRKIKFSLYPCCAASIFVCT